MRIALQHPLEAGTRRRRRQPCSAAFLKSSSHPRRRAEIGTIAQSGRGCRRLCDTAMAREAVSVTLVMWYKHFVVIDCTGGVNVAPNSHTPHLHVLALVKSCGIVLVLHNFSHPRDRSSSKWHATLNLISFFPSTSAILYRNNIPPGTISWQSNTIRDLKPRLRELGSRSLCVSEFKIYNNKSIRQCDASACALHDHPSAEIKCLNRLCLELRNSKSPYSRRPLLPRVAHDVHTHPRSSKTA